MKKILPFDFKWPLQWKFSGKKMTSEEAAAVAMAIEREFIREDEVAAAIAMALEAEGYGDVHDVESYVITIKR